MANDLLVTTGQQILFNVAGSYSPATLNNLELGTATDVAFDLTSVAAAAAEASAKADLTATWAPQYAVHAAIEMAVAPVTGTTFDFYWAPSVNSTAGAGNPGYVSGSSAAYTGTPGTLAEGLAQLMYFGTMVMGADATGTIQMAFVGVITPPTRYGCLVVVNNTAQATHSDVVEQAVSFTPIIPEVQ
ncbi:MAG: hypothetical protein ACYS29_00965 [Planctomycetota bacterium]|jgi:hypothetical protein